MIDFMGESWEFSIVFLHRTNQPSNSNLNPQNSKTLALRGFLHVPGAGIEPALPSLEIGF
jgi:hypothetical protein